MLKPSFAIRPEGAAAIGLSAFSALIFSILDCVPLALLFWLLAIFSVNFFRDPERVPPTGSNICASPADGKIVKIEKRANPFNGVECLVICVFMNVFSVHVNRAPVACRVKEICYIPGAYFNASFDKASTDNERCQWLLEDRDGREWTMVQIAGLVARRIVGWAQLGDELYMGERMGMIRFGSRVDLYLPQGYEPVVKIGDKVFAGETVLAKLG